MGISMVEGGGRKAFLRGAYVPQIFSKPLYIEIEKSCLEKIGPFFNLNGAPSSIEKILVLPILQIELEEKLRAGKWLFL